MRRFLNTGNVALEAAPAFDSSKPFAFLGGTIAGSQWREWVKALLTVPAFDPVVANWTTEDAQRENQAKGACSLLVYGLTPKQQGFYSIAEMTAACAQHRHMDVAILVLDDDEGTVWAEHQAASVSQIRELLQGYPGVHIFQDVQALANFVNAELATSAN